MLSKFLSDKENQKVIELIVEAVQMNNICALSIKRFEMPEESLKKLEITPKKKTKGIGPKQPSLRELILSVKDEVKSVRDEVKSFKNEFIYHKEETRKNFLQVNKRLDHIEQDVRVLKEDVRVLKEDMTIIKSLPTISKELKEQEKSRIN